MTKNRLIVRDCNLEPEAEKRTNYQADYYSLRNSAKLWQHLEKEFKEMKNEKFHGILRIDYGAKECIV